MLHLIEQQIAGNRVTQMILSTATGNGQPVGMTRVVVMLQLLVRVLIL
jgi:hypothetical protein